MRAICDSNGILLIADEIQTGIGRTGTMFAMEQFGVSADITATAKSLVKYCFDRGLIILSCGTYANVIRLLMPLNIPEDLLNKGLDIIEQGLKTIRD